MLCCSLVVVVVVVVVELFRGPESNTIYIIQHQPKPTPNSSIHPSIHPPRVLPAGRSAAWGFNTTHINQAQTPTPHPSRRIHQSIHRSIRHRQRIPCRVMSCLPDGVLRGLGLLLRADRGHHGDVQEAAVLVPHLGFWVFWCFIFLGEKKRKKGVYSHTPGRVGRFWCFYTTMKETKEGSY